MKNVSKIRWNRQMLFGIMFMLTVFIVGLGTTIVSHAESKGKIVASSSVNIRQEASASSAAIGSAERGAEVDVKGKVTASDGTMWYQVYVNGTTLGYIRGDLVEITDGSTPPAVTGNATTPGTDTSSTPANTTDVIAVEPMSATVTNSRTVRVRAGASTETNIVTTAQNGVALTVTGQTTGSDGKIWYQVNFISDGTEVVGFIRSDYVALSGELVPVTTAPPATEEPPVVETPPVEQAPIVEDKDWDTQLQGSDWYLLNKVKGEQIKISDLYEGVAHNKQLYEECQKEVKSQKVAIIILVLLVIALAAIAAMLGLKLKDIKDTAYFNQVERETLRRRNGNKASSGQKVMHTVGGEKNPASRPQGGKTAAGKGQVVKPQGGQPQGNRPAGGQGQSVRPQGGQPQGNRPAETQGQTPRPQGGQPRGSRPAGAQGQSVRPQGGQPQGNRPAGDQGQSPRPQGGQPQSNRPAEAPGNGSMGAKPNMAEGPVNRTVSPRPQQRPAEGQTANGQGQGWQSKNFMTDDDEFEFEFLNWDGSEDK